MKGILATAVVASALLLTGCGVAAPKPASSPSATPTVSLSQSVSPTSTPSVDPKVASAAEYNRIAESTWPSIKRMIALSQSRSSSNKKKWRTECKSSADDLATAMADLTAWQ